MKFTLYCVAAAYISTCVITTSSVLYDWRERFKAVTPSLYKGPTKKHFIDCRLCVGFYMSITTTGMFSLLPQQLVDVLGTLAIVYAGSYFMATQER